MASRTLQNTRHASTTACPTVKRYREVNRRAWSRQVSMTHHVKPAACRAEYSTLRPNDLFTSLMLIGLLYASLKGERWSSVSRSLVIAGSDLCTCRLTNSCINIASFDRSRHYISIFSHSLSLKDSRFKDPCLPTMRSLYSLCRHSAIIADQFLCIRTNLYLTLLQFHNYCHILECN